MCGWIKTYKLGWGEMSANTLWGCLLKRWLSLGRGDQSSIPSRPRREVGSTANGLCLYGVS